MRSQWHTGACVCVCARMHRNIPQCHLHRLSAGSGSLCHQTVYSTYSMCLGCCAKVFWEVCGRSLDWNLYRNLCISNQGNIVAKTRQNNIIAKEILLSFTKNGQADIKRGAKSTDCCCWWRKKCSASVCETNSLHTRTHTIYSVPLPLLRCQRPCIVPSSEPYVPPSTHSHKHTCNLTPPNPLCSFGRNLFISTLTRREKNWMAARLRRVSLSAASAPMYLQPEKNTWVFIWSPSLPTVNY